MKTLKSEYHFNPLLCPGYKILGEKDVITNQTEWIDLDGYQPWSLVCALYPEHFGKTVGITVARDVVCREKID